MFLHFNFKMKGISELSLATNYLNPFPPSHKEKKKKQDRLVSLVHILPSLPRVRCNLECGFTLHTPLGQFNTFIFL